MIDKSRSTHWRKNATNRIEPIVREFGFLNYDIGCLANIIIKGKEQANNNFKEKIIELIDAVNCEIKVPEFDIFVWALLYEGKDGYTESSRYILVIYILYYLNILKQNKLIQRLSKLFK